MPVDTRPTESAEPLLQPSDDGHLQDPGLAPVHQTSSANSVSTTNEKITPEARPSLVILETGSVSRSNQAFQDPLGATNREIEFNYKPLPPVPDFLTKPGCLPPSYSSLSIKPNTTGGNTSSSDRPNPSGVTSDGNPRRTRSSSTTRAGRSLYNLGIGVFDVESSQSSEDNVQMMVCAGLACLCVPMIGWIPIVLGCLALQDGVQPSRMRSKMRRFVLISSVVCILVGLMITASYFAHCMRFHKGSVSAGFAGCHPKSSWGGLSSSAQSQPNRTSNMVAIAPSHGLW